jgi:hypothetical protein
MMIGTLLRIVYALRLRSAFIWLQRRFKGEHKETRTPVRNFASPDELARFARPRFQYRKDYGEIFGVRFPLDWPTDPEVFQTRLDSKKNVDGDCDDYHVWAAVALSLIDGVQKVYILSTIYTGGGHTCCVFKFNGNWFLLNYGIESIDDPNDAPAKVADWATENPKIYAYVFENVEPAWSAAAIGPNQKVPL